jgi:hypothetical protein
VPIQNLVAQIRSEAQQLMKLNNDNKPHFMMEPYLTIARKLQPWQYEKGWLEYSNKHFTGRFIADAMLLLKRPAGEMKYQIIQRFEFQNLPVAKQIHSYVEHRCVTLLYKKCYVERSLNSMHLLINSCNQYSKIWSIKIK